MSELGRQRQIKELEKKGGRGWVRNTKCAGNNIIIILSSISDDYDKVYVEENIRLVNFSRYFQSDFKFWNEA